jgi:hypothetical protein
MQSLAREARRACKMMTAWIIDENDELSSVYPHNHPLTSRFMNGFSTSMKDKAETK